MSNVTYTVTLPDGTTDSRKSHRPYTHAVVVVTTAVERTARIDKCTANIPVCQAAVDALRAQCEDPGVREAYTAVKAERDFYDEKIPDPKYPERMTERWLTMRGDGLGGATSPGLKLTHEVNRRYYASPVVMLEQAERALAGAYEALISAGAVVVGAAGVYGWSMSVKNASKMVNDARKRRPLATVFATSDIVGRVHGVRRAKVV